MAKKASFDSGSSGPKGEFDDIIGFALLVLALLVLIAQFSFDPLDLRYNTTSPNHPLHNWIGTIGAHLAFLFFFLFGAAAYALPFLLAAFGLSRLFAGMAHLRRHSWWSAGCGLLLLISLTGLLQLAHPHAREAVFPSGAGGLLGETTFGQTQAYNYGFSMLGSIGATIAYLALGGVSLLFLTKFELGAWLSRLWETWRTPAGMTNAEEAALERRARDLEKQARKLQEQVDKSSGIARRPGRGSQTVARTDRARFERAAKQTGCDDARKKSGEPAVEPAPPDEGVVIPAREVAAATSKEILGKKPETRFSNGKDQRREGCRQGRQTGNPRLGRNQ